MTDGGGRERSGATFGKWLAGIAATVIAGVLTVIVLDHFGSQSHDAAAGAASPSPTPSATMTSASPPPPPPKMVNRVWRDALTNPVHPITPATKFSVTCPARQVSIGGGFNFAGPDVKVLASRPDPDNAAAWQIVAYTSRQTGLNGAAYATCVDDMTGLDRQVIAVNATASGSDRVLVQSQCPAGQMVMGGGFSTPDNSALFMLGSWPDLDSARTWDLDIRAVPSGVTDRTDRSVRAYAVCVAQVPAMQRIIFHKDTTWMPQRPYAAPVATCDQGLSVSGGWHIQGVDAESSRSQSLDGEAKPDQWIVGATNNLNVPGQISVYVVCAHFS
jgi:hypothetical protein